MTASLQGVRIIDMSHVIAGPLASYFLAQLGADVIKIEKPGSGDVLRANTENPTTDTPTGFSAFNAGKKSLAIDIRTPEGAEAIRALAQNANVFIENFRPGIVKKYGLDYESIKKINPKIVYCSISGYGQKGQWATRGGYDQVIQALTGMMMMSGPENDTDPTKVGFPVIDVAVGMLGALSITSAIYRQSTQGVGQYIETSLIQAALMLMYPYTTDYLTDKKVSKRLGNKGYSGSPASDAFKCDDGWISTAANTPTQFKKMMHLLNLDAICNDAELIDLNAFNAKNGGFVVAKDPALVKKKIQDALLSKSATNLEEQLNAIGVPAAKVRTLAEFLDELSTNDKVSIPLHTFKQTNKTIKTAGLGFTLDDGSQINNAPSPRLGEHTIEILKNIGLSELQISKMLDANILK
ncbi:CaiB/BaiF CoA transferase family protein [Polynucleobacter sinensis]|uniref:CaiB/BaiF CoA transferase family protein n=1 Tax=Polynucleobacter sinensis TaxID=1743157 RepID=UPI0007831323|nr:CoA transferase [Polynucleobacter sinensis]